MKKFSFVLLLILTSASVFAIWDKEKTDAFLRAMDLAADPSGKGRSIKSIEVISEGVVDKMNLKIKSRIIYKRPGLMRSDFETVNLQKTTIYYNNGKALKVDELAGVVPIEGQMLEELKMQVAQMDPASSIRDIYDKIEIQDELQEYNGRKFVRLTCSFKPEQKLLPVRILVDPQTKLVTCIFTFATTEYGVVESVTENQEFRTINGMVVPTRFVQRMIGISMSFILKSFSVNKEYPDGIFEYSE